MLALGRRIDGQWFNIIDLFSFVLEGRRRKTFPVQMFAVRTNVGIQAEVIQNPGMYYSWAHNTLPLPPFSFSVLTTSVFTLLRSRLWIQIRQGNFNIFVISYWTVFFLFFILQGNSVTDGERVYVTVVHYSIIRCSLVGYVVKLYHLQVRYWQRLWTTSRWPSACHLQGVGL